MWYEIYHNGKRSNDEQWYMYIYYNHWLHEQGDHEMKINYKLYTTCVLRNQQFPWKSIKNVKTEKYPGAKRNRMLHA